MFLPAGIVGGKTPSAHNTGSTDKNATRGPLIVHKALSRTSVQDIPSSTGGKRRSVYCSLCFAVAGDPDAQTLASVFDTHRACLIGNVREKSMRRERVQASLMVWDLRPGRVAQKSSRGLAKRDFHSQVGVTTRLLYCFGFAVSHCHPSGKIR
jgi:hypothetical protein